MKLAKSYSSRPLSARGSLKFARSTRDRLQIKVSEHPSALGARLVVMWSRFLSMQAFTGWLNYQLRASNAPNNVIITEGNFNEELKDGVELCHLLQVAPYASLCCSIHSHLLAPHSGLGTKRWPAQIQE